MRVNQPLMSVVVPTYNHAHLIGKCLQSLIDQTYTNWEALVVNNFSSDNTEEVVASFNDSRIQLINNHNNGIIAVSRNIGIEASKGEWICFLDSDDWWTPNKLEECLPYLETYDIIYHDKTLYFQSTNSYGKTLKGCQITDYSVGELLSNRNQIINSSVVIRKSVVDTVGKITEDKALIAVEDFDYWIRILQYTHKAKYIPQSLGYYYIGSNISVSLKQIDRKQALFDKYKDALNDAQLREALAKFNYDYARLYHVHKYYKQARKCYVIATNSSKYFLKSIIGYSFALLNIKL